MRENSNVALCLARSILSGPQRRAQTPLVPRDATLHLPPLAVLAAGELGFHLPTITGFRAAITGIPRVQGKYGGSDAKFLAGQAVIPLAVVAGVAQQTIEPQMRTSLSDGRAELDMVGPRSLTDDGSHKKMAVGVAYHRELGPAVPYKRPVFLALQDVMPRCMTRLHTRGVDGGLDLALDQATRSRSADNGGKEEIESPFFTRRS